MLPQACGPPENSKSPDDSAATPERHRGAMGRSQAARVASRRGVSSSAAPGQGGGKAPPTREPAEGRFPSGPRTTARQGRRRQTHGGREKARQGREAEGERGDTDVVDGVLGGELSRAFVLGGGRHGWRIGCVGGRDVGRPGDRGGRARRKGGPSERASERETGRTRETSRRGMGEETSKGRRRAREQATAAQPRPTPRWPASRRGRQSTPRPRRAQSQHGTNATRGTRIAPGSRSAGLRVDVE